MKRGKQKQFRPIVALFTLVFTFVTVFGGVNVKALDTSAIDQSVNGIVNQSAEVGKVLGFNPLDVLVQDENLALTYAENPAKIKFEWQYHTGTNWQKSKYTGDFTTPADGSLTKFQFGTSGVEAFYVGKKIRLCIKDEVNRKEYYSSEYTVKSAGQSTGENPTPTAAAGNPTPAAGAPTAVPTAVAGEPTPAAGVPTATVGEPTPAAGTPTAAAGEPTPTAGTPISTDGNVINCDKAGTFTKSYDVSCKGKSENLVIKNSSNIIMKLTVSVKSGRVKISADNKLEGLAVNNSFSGENKVVVYMKPNEEQAIDFAFRTDYTGGCEVTVAAEPSDAEDKGGDEFGNAQEMELSGSEKGYIYHPGMNSDASLKEGKCDRYFSITVPTKRFVEISLSSKEVASSRAYTLDRVGLELYSAEDTEQKNNLIKDFSANGETPVEKTVLLEKGKYVIKLRRMDNACAAIYQLTLGGREYISATGIKLTSTQPAGLVKMKDGETKKITITAETVPANSDDKLKRIDGLTNEEGGDLNLDLSEEKDNKVTFDVSLNMGDARTIKVIAANGKNEAISFTVPPKKPIGGVALDSYPNRVHFSGLDFSSQHTAYAYVKKGNKWENVKTINDPGDFTITKLKPNTMYQFKFVIKNKGSDGTVAESEPLYRNVKTGINIKPQIKSVKFSNIKETYKNVWTSTPTGGYWSKKYTTWYTAKVTLKKKVPGTIGMSINGVRAKGKGTTFTVKMSSSGRKGQKLYINVSGYSMAADYGAYTPQSKTKTVKLK